MTLVSMALAVALISSHLRLAEPSKESAESSLPSTRNESVHMHENAARKNGSDLPSSGLQPCPWTLLLESLKYFLSALFP